MQIMENENKGLTPRQIVAQLDKYIIGQYEAKKMVAIALRNRARRKEVPPELRDEVSPKNIIMIGPTGVGKTEIARRLSRLAQAPFIKVEATKYTEVGYVGRDVESMIRDLTDVAVSMVREEKTAEVVEKAQRNAEERLLDLLLPAPPAMRKGGRREEEDPGDASQVAPTAAEGETLTPQQKWLRTREKLAKRLREGKLENQVVEVEMKAQGAPMIAGFSIGAGIEEMGLDLKNFFDRLMPQKTRMARMPLSEARHVLVDEEVDKLLDMDKVIKEAMKRVQESGIVFIDEFDKIAGRGTLTSGPDVSREGVQRDILPIVEGSTVFTKYGMVSTDHILFIAAGAFHASKPSDLIPELQGRFPLRVELKPLTVEDFKRILTEPQNALTKQYKALLETEGIELHFADDGIDEIARSAFAVNERTESIGARRLYTILEKILEDISFEAPDVKDKTVIVDCVYVRDKLKDILKDEDLSKFIL
jgi:ATP-dependent HslUV protease ATP-binding subunit HslU